MTTLRLKQIELAGAVLPKDYITGLDIAFSAANAITVGPGDARSSSNAANLTNASTQTVDIVNVINAVNGLERKTLSGTVAVNSASALVTGTGTAFLTEFAPANTPRTLTGTIGTGGVGSTTITGVGTKFFSEVAVDDLIGNSTVGYVRVTAIASDTSLTVVASIAIANGSTGRVLENLTIEVNSERRGIDFITNDTSLTADSNFSATASGQAIHTGNKHSSSSRWFAVWLASGGLFFSTQRTTPFLSISGIGTHYRRIGWVRSSNSAIVDFVATRMGRRMRVDLEVEAATFSTRVLSAGPATAWADVVCTQAVPPTASVIRGTGEISGATTAYFRPRNIGATGVSRNRYVRPVGLIECPIQAQVMQYVNSAGGGSTNFDVIGWEETV